MTNFPNYIFIDDSSINFSTVDNIVRTEMDSGMAKTKQRDSIPVAITSFDVSINRSDLFNFYKWFNFELKSGQRWFLLRDPVFGIEKRFRFAETRFDWSKIGTLLTTRFVLESYLDVQ